jgi:hypothetical protein
MATQQGDKPFGIFLFCKLLASLRIVPKIKVSACINSTILARLQMQPFSDFRQIRLWNMRFQQNCRPRVVDLQQCRNQPEIVDPAGEECRTAGKMSSKPIPVPSPSLHPACSASSFLSIQLNPLFNKVCWCVTGITTNDQKLANSKPQLLKRLQSIPYFLTL